jgi:hypothetical protein
MGRARIEHRVADDGTESKRCSTCAQWLALAEFGTDRQRWDGLAHVCHLCARRATAKSRGRKPRATPSPHTGKYSVAVWGSKSAARTAWRRDHPERDREARLRSDAKNRERIRERDRARNSSEARQVWRTDYNRQYYEADKASRIAQVNQWRKDNPERARLKGLYDRARRRARQRALPVEPWTEQQIIDRDGLICWIKGCPVGGALTSGRRDWAIDHLIPISVDYPDHPGDTAPNLAIACHACNQGKAARLLPEAIARYQMNAAGSDQIPRGIRQRCLETSIRISAAFTL